MDMELVVIVALLFAASCSSNELRVEDCSCEKEQITTVRSRNSYT